MSSLVIPMDEGGPPPLVGSAQVGSELWRTFGAIHTTRNNAHREHVENAMSARASCIDFKVTPATALGAREEAHAMLSVFTDT